MAFFSWFTKKFFNVPALAATKARSKSTAAHEGVSSSSAQDPVNQPESRKARRHARREQLFIAVRESMTRSGVLAASYKFKVLSLDQAGDQFLVMLDVDTSLGHQTLKLSEMEAMVVQTAKARFDLFVTSVYWRMETAAAPGTVRAPGHKVPPATINLPSGVTPLSPASARYEPLQDDEVAAFKKALAASSGPSKATLDATGKSHSGAHSYTLLTGFEDTELPGPAAAPALSATQYGDLN